MRAAQYGGQAVIEGVMMRGLDAFSVAVRRPDGNIGVKREETPAPSRRKGPLAWPVVRGAGIFIDSLTIGVRSLVMSMDMASAEDEKLGPAAVSATIIGALAFATCLFIVLPTVLMSAARRSLSMPSLLLNIAEGLLRAGIFAVYIYAISRMQDVQRVLAFHGAEHKAINAYDRGQELTIENVRGNPRLHPRCGTSFLMFVVLVGSVLFSFFGWPGVIQRVLLRLALLPLVAGISYEIIRFSGRSRSPLVKAACAPGMWFQRMTTREPDDNQIEVAIVALKAILPP
jgi:uncharacterized protein YqhQ